MGACIQSDKLAVVYTCFVVSANKLKATDNGACHHWSRRGPPCMSRIILKTAHVNTDMHLSPIHMHRRRDHYCRLSHRVGRCELTARQVRSVSGLSECVGRRSATARLTPTQNDFVRRSVHTATPDKTKLPRLPVDRRRRRDSSQAGSYA